MIPLLSAGPRVGTVPVLASTLLPNPPEPQQSALENMGGFGAVGRATRVSPVGLAKALASKPRGMAGNLPTARAPAEDSPEVAD